MNERVRVRARSFTCRVTRGCHRIKPRASVVSFRSHTARLDAGYRCSTFCSIRFDSIRFPRWMFSRIIASRVITRIPFIFFAFIHVSSIHPSTRTSSTSTSSSRYVPVPLLRNVYFFHPRRRSSSSIVVVVVVTHAVDLSRASSSPVIHRALRRADHLRSLFAVVRFRPFV